MDLRALHAFRMVAECGSITAAAARLGTVQPALSTRISQFETELGESLFERLPRGIRLTPAGRRLLPHAERIEALVAEAAADARGYPRALSGPFRLGAVEIAAPILADGIARFLAAHAEVELRFVTGVSRQLIADVERGALDAAVISEGSRAAGLLTIPLSQIPLALFGPIDGAVLDRALAFGEGCVCRARLETLLQRRHRSPRIIELDSVDAILGCVEAGIGMALLPQALDEGRAVTTEPCGKLDLNLVCRPDAQELAQAFVAGA